MAAPRRSPAGGPDELVRRLAAIGDPVRLRLLRLLDREELGVGELARCVRLPQSTVSRHVASLADAGFLAKRSEGTATLLRVIPGSMDAISAELWSAVKPRLAAGSEPDPDYAEDDARLKAVLAERRVDSRTFFGRVGADWTRMREQLFGDGVTATAMLAFLDPAWTVADVGCGTGEAAAVLAPFVGKVVAIDREPAMLDAARARLSGRKNVEFRRGEIENLPGKPGEFDAAVVMLLLHHLEDPAAALRSVARVVSPGAPVLVVDMVPHGHEEYRQAMGHRHLGFSESQLKAHAKAAGLSLRSFVALPADTQRKGPRLFAAVLFASGVSVRPGTSRSPGKA
jgi:ArsR family transcriptional regulator